MENQERMEQIGGDTFEIINQARQMVKPGVRMIEVARKVEELILKKELQCAFPINLSVNERAAHYTPSFDDQTIFSEKDVVKVDIGLREQDMLTDCAVTVDLSGNHSKLMEATQEALEAAISSVREGRRVCDIGKEVEKVTKRHGVLPIRNLGGHGIGEGELHANYFIPNFDNGDVTELREGDMIAVEVFLTDGKGEVEDGEYNQIFRKFPGVSARERDKREVSDYIDENYRTYPFALRWLVEKFGSEFRARATLNELARQDALESFPVLVEKGRGTVVQFEKSVIVEKEGCRIITQE
ncbi:MAG: type II methionyl aminopeptidase [Candidatus Micrarchaeota archaeon]|nr:type II methionyl aminopeptidase [Candidatus Micrarchaeota archaeon]MDE1847906.1 type II methionyl aminopeptidase [Candidatus Micrarchaeota archaeon]MDE1864532.1 type II methionyl aminopeptidase [Candidatus Micrarchaeota archaeon]